jgi:hypothetical protein
LVTICFLSPSMFASHMALSLAVGREETVATGDWNGYFGLILPPSRGRRLSRKCTDSSLINWLQ